MNPHATLSKHLVLLMTTVICSACATTAKFDPSKPLEEGKVYRQEGQFVDFGDLLSKLKENPKTREAAQSASTYAWAANGAGSLGGGLLALALVLPKAEPSRCNGNTCTAAKSGLSSGASWALAGGSAAALIGSWILHSRFKERLAEAVSIHNGSLKSGGAETSRFVVEPYLSVADAGPVCGLSFSW